MAEKKKTTKKDSKKATKSKEKKSTKKTATKKPDDSFAIIETGGKQYRVAPGDTIAIEILKEKEGKKKGSKIVFDKVLLVDNGKDTQIGDPYLKGAKVEGTLEEEGKGKKINVLRFKSKSRYLKQKGHRQPYMKVNISAIK